LQVRPDRTRRFPGCAKETAVKRLLPIGIALVLLGGTLAAAQSEAESKVLDDYVQMVKGDLTAKRDSALRTLVQLEPGQSDTFWDLVKAYDNDAKALREKRMAMLADFIKVHDQLTEAKAQELADRAFTLADERMALRKKYFQRMSDEVSTVAAVQFLQLQGQFETMGDLKIATAMPLAVK
jgi:hypothetical protein